MKTRRKYGAASVVALAVLGIAALLGACGAKHKTVAVPRTAPSTAARTTTTPPTTAAKKRVVKKPVVKKTVAAVTPVCPLTDTPAPGGRVPARPALAIKVENLPEARPQYGLSAADVVYEEPVEGGITRFIVIYQCHDASRVEPVRSGRLIDPSIVDQFGAHPLFAYAGAIAPAVSAIDSSSLIDLSAMAAPPSVYPRDPTRYAPHNLMTSTGALYAYAASLHGPQTTPPASPFVFGALSPKATPAASVHIGYVYSDLTWTWQAATHTWVRSYTDTGPATMGEGGVVSAANVIVMSVGMYPSPYVEDATGIHENLLTLTGSGPAQVFRDGTVTTGTWNRAGLSEDTRYLDSSGKPIALGPGQTWIELVPTTVGVTVTP
ncbi:MAG: DUF3048 domain-containing protein [Acidimicrobiaceae bacterium]|nr:DUF3048 domain-containing protein [Acidimicrobiaceae bacterium]